MQKPDDAALFTVFDATAMLFRSYYGVRSMPSPEDIEVNGVFGTVQALASLMKRLKPRHVAVVFDAGERTFRNELDPRYKANRGSPPDDLLPQFYLVQQAVESLGFATYCVPGFEADDLMATLSAFCQEEEVPCRLVSNDKDLCQLVRDAPPSVLLYDPQKSRYTDEAGTVERLGVPPHKANDLQALVGDSTDNIPGVHKVGPKTAQALLASFDSLEAIYEDLDAVEGLSIRGAKSLRKRLEEGREEAFLAKQLVTLRKDVPLGHTSAELLEKTLWKGPRAEADTFFSRLGFHRPLRRLEELAQARFQA